MNINDALAHVDNIVKNYCTEFNCRKNARNVLDIVRLSCGTKEYISSEEYKLNLVYQAAWSIAWANHLLSFWDEKLINNGLLYDGQIEMSRFLESSECNRIERYRHFEDYQSLINYCGMSDMITKWSQTFASHVAYEGFYIGAYVKGELIERYLIDTNMNKDLLLEKELVLNFLSQYIVTDDAETNSVTIEYKAGM